MKALNSHKNIFTTLFFVIALVFTGTNLNAQDLSKVVSDLNDEHLSIEDWMTDIESFADTPNEDSPLTLVIFFNDENFEEEELSIAEWMVNPDSYFEATHNQFNFAQLEEENETLALEGWMTNLKAFFDAPAHKLPSINTIILNEPPSILIALHNPYKQDK